MERALVAGKIIFAAHFIGQFEHAYEMRRDPLAVSHLVFLDRRKRGFWIELLHHHNRAAQPMHGGRPADRCRVIERRW